MERQELAGLSTQERKIISHFSAIEESTINADKLIEFHPYKRSTANQILRRLALKGWLQRLKYGVYAIVPITSTTATPVIENAWSIVMDLFNPAYISGWTAAEHWDLTDQIFNSISVSTMSPQRESIQLIGNIKFRTKLLDKEQFFGIKKIWIGSNGNFWRNKSKVREKRKNKSPILFSDHKPVRGSFKNFPGIEIHDDIRRIQKTVQNPLKQLDNLTTTVGGTIL